MKTDSRNSENIQRCNYISKEVICTELGDTFWIKQKWNACRYIHRYNASIYKTESEQIFVEDQKKGTLIMWTGIPWVENYSQAKGSEDQD